jgi:hypothetical protein
MTLKHAPSRKQRRYLRKIDLCARYGWKVTLSVDRAWQVYKTLPPPTLYQGRRPLWDADILDAHDAARTFDASE